MSDFVIDDTVHDVGNLDCPECWPGYPVPCECGGLVHAIFGDEDADCNYWLDKLCDKCNIDYCEVD